MNIQEFSSQDTLNPSVQNGTVCSKSRLCFLIVVVAVVTGLAVGLAVYYVHPDKGKVEHIEQSTKAKSAVVTTPEPAADDGIYGPLLPGSLKPIHYELRIRPDIYRDNPDNFQFSGSVRIDVDVLKCTKVITLHVKDLDIAKRKIDVKGSNNKKVGVVTFWYIIPPLHLCDRAPISGPNCAIMRFFEIFSRIAQIGSSSSENR